MRPKTALLARSISNVRWARAKRRSSRACSPRPTRGFLYIDEINLLEDHIVDLLLDVAASGENVVEREGLSVRHSARFVLIGSGNPEEGELRPQLLDRFGLSLEVRTSQDLDTRVEILRRCDAFERTPETFAADWAKAEKKTLNRIAKAKKLLPELVVPDAILRSASELCIAVGADGLRGELTLMRAARAAAGTRWQGRGRVDAIARGRADGAAPPAAGATCSTRPARPYGSSGH